MIYRPHNDQCYVDKWLPIFEYYKLVPSISLGKLLNKNESKFGKNNDKIFRKLLGLG